MGESAKDILDIIVSLEAKMCEHDVSTYDNSFNVRFLRPINVEDSKMEITESTSSSTIINLRDLVIMSDWRSTEVYPIWRDENMDYWNYYNIKSIKVIGASDEKEGSIINEYIYTNLGRGVYEGINKTNSYRLDNITDQVRFRYYPVQGPVAQYDKNNPTNYGYIEYINYGSETNDFKVLVPLKVEYEWGAVYCDATITIKTAEETTNSFFKEGTYNWNFGVSFDGTEYYSVVKPFNLDLEEKNYDMSNLSQSLVGVKANKWNIDGFLGFFPDATERQLPAYSYFQNIEGVDVEFLSVVDKDGLLSVGNIKIGTETYECYLGDISDDNKLYVDWLFATINDDVIYLGGTPCIFTFDGDAPVLLMDLKDLTILPNGTISETKSIRYGKPKPFDGKIVITGRSKFDYELVVSDKLKRFIRNR